MPARTANLLPTSPTALSCAPAGTVRWLCRSALRLFDSVPLRTLPPNVITATAMAFGLSSVYQSLAVGDLQLAAWFVLLSVLLDKLDGSVARLLKGSSEFGVQFDSFSDATAFGIAPAALIFAAARAFAPAQWGPAATVMGVSATAVLAAICLSYAVMTAVRLAKFNVTTAAIGPALFLGLPSTLSGGLICSAFLAVHEHGINVSQPWIFSAFPWLLLFNAALMVCNLPLPKFKASSQPALRAFQVACGLAVYVLVPLRLGFGVVLVLLLGYLAIGFAWLGPRLLRQSQQTGQS